MVGSRRSGDSRAASTGSGGNWRLAVVIPTHDRADLLRRSIESVLRQERTADQIIVVDDGSRDDTAAVVTGYAPTVTYVPKAHGGVASARNLGVAQSDADFIAFLDSDDHWDEGHLHRTEAAIEMTRGKAWLYFSDLRLDRDRETAESIWRACELEIHDTFAFREDGREWVLLPRQPMMIPAAVVRRDAYLAVGGQAENLTCREDTHFFLKLGYFNERLTEWVTAQTHWRPAVRNFTLGLLRLPLIPVIVLIGAQAFVLSQLGLRLGTWVSAGVREGAERVAGLALIVLGLVLLAEKVTAG